MAVDPSACIGCSLVPAPHSSVAVRNRRRRDGARLPRATWNKWKGPASAQRSEAGVGSGPFMPRKALATGRAALRFAPEAADGRRGADVPCDGGASGRAQSRAAHRTRLTKRAGRRRISGGNHRCDPHNACVEFNRPCGSSWASFAFPAHACHEAHSGHRLAVGTIDKVTTCHQAIGCSGGAGGNFHLTEDSQYLRRQHGNRVRDGQRWLAAL